MLRVVILLGCWCFAWWLAFYAGRHWDDDRGEL